MWTGGTGKTVAILGVVLAAGFAGRQSATMAPVGTAARAAAPVGASPAGAGRVRAEGRLAAYPGAEVRVGTERGGTVARVLVAERDTVRRGQLLAELDAAEPRAALEEARARLAEADTSVRFFDSEAARFERLWKDKVVARQELDRAQHEREAARARRAVSRATVRRLEVAVEKCRLVAPIDGVVLERAVEAGQTVEPGASVFTVADLTRTRVEAEVDEYDAGRVEPGAAVGITAEGHEGRRWRGTVEEVPDAVTSRSLEPQDPGRPSDTRVLRVKVRLDEPTPLKLGQRVEVEIGR